MNLMEVLLFQDQKELVKLLKENYHSVGNVNSKRELIELLYPSLTNNEQLKERFQQLSIDAQKLALTLAFDRKLFISKEELHGIIPYVVGPTFSLVLNQLISSGVIFAYSNGNYIMPVQIKREIVNSIKATMADHSFLLPSFDQDQKELTVVHDLFAFIDFVTDQPLVLTKTGIMYKKDFQAIMKLFSYQETLPNEQWRFGYGRRFSQYPDRFSLLYDYCYANSWISEANNTVIVTEHVEELYEMRLNELIRSIVTYWLKLYRRPFPTIGLLYEIFIRSLRDGEGIEEEFLISMFSPFVQEYYFDSKVDLIVKRFLNMLCYLDITKKVDSDLFVGYTKGPGKQFLE